MRTQKASAPGRMTTGKTRGGLEAGGPDGGGDHAAPERVPASRPRPAAASFIPGTAPLSRAGRSRAAAWLAAARLGAAVAAMPLAGADPPFGGREAGPLLAILLLSTGSVFAHAIGWRGGNLTLRRRTIGGLTVGEAVAATAAVAFTGGAASPALPYAALAAAGAGLRLGVVAGALAGAAAAAATLPSVGAQALPISLAGATVSLFPLAGIAGALAARAWEIDRRDETRRHAETVNRLLAALSRLARATPGGLELSGPASRTLAAARGRLGSPASALLVAAGTSFTLARSAGLGSTALAREGILAPVDADTLSRAVARGRTILSPDAARPFGSGCWLAAPLTHQGSLVGVLAAACPAHAHHARHLTHLEALARDAAPAVDNARLLRALRERSVDEERSRIARELHDGTVQALVHLHLELSLLGGRESGRAKGDLERLARVVEHTLSDVRATIRGLVPPAGGLAARLQVLATGHARQSGPAFALELEPVPPLDPSLEAEVFRIAQEAVSNALRHASAKQVRIALLVSTAGLLLRVEDDGSGIGPRPRGGMGLPAMRERARRIGGALEVSIHPGGGTRVELTLPLAALDGAPARDGRRDRRRGWRSRAPRTGSQVGR